MSQFKALLVTGATEVLDRAELLPEYIDTILAGGMVGRALVNLSWEP